jgi:hypothetical protein
MAKTKKSNGGTNNEGFSLQEDRKITTALDPHL